MGRSPETRSPSLGSGLGFSFQSPALSPAPQGNGVTCLGSCLYVNRAGGPGGLSAARPWLSLLRV